jgi:hypothetical protein
MIRTVEWSDDHGDGRRAPPDGTYPIHIASGKAEIEEVDQVGDCMAAQSPPESMKAGPLNADRLRRLDRRAP